MSKDFLEIDDEIDYLTDKNHLENDTERKKKTLVNTFEETGTILLKEIENKKRVKRLKQIKLVKYILKHSGNNYIDVDLMTYDFNDVVSIYNEIKIKKKHLFTKILRFIFNIE